MISAQSSKPNMCIVQDSLLGAYRMTLGIKQVSKEQFFNISLSIGIDLINIQKKMQTIRRIFKDKGKKVQCFHGKGLISLVLPDDLIYERKNNADPNEPTVKIYRGVLYEGALDKSTLGAVSNSLIHVIHKEYGPDRTAEFIDGIQFVTNNWLLISGFSVGLGDCMVQGADKVQEIDDVIKRCYIEAEGIKTTTTHPGIKEIRILGTLSKAKDIGLKIAKDALDKSNNFISTVVSGYVALYFYLSHIYYLLLSFISQFTLSKKFSAKGDFFNIAQITGLLGQQNVLGQRVKPTLNNGKRTLPHYGFDNLDLKDEYESRGFIDSSFIRGLNPKQFYMHSMSGKYNIIYNVLSKYN